MPMAAVPNDSQRLDQDLALADVFRRYWLRLRFHISAYSIESFGKALWRARQKSTYLRLTHSSGFRQHLLRHSKLFRESLGTQASARQIIVRHAIYYIFAYLLASVSRHMQWRLCTTMKAGGAGMGLQRRARDRQLAYDHEGLWSQGYGLGSPIG